MLSSERRRAVKGLVAAALRCEPATRDEFIRGASQGDVSLSEEALRLLQRIHEKRLEMGSSAVSDADLLDQAAPDPTSSPTDTGVLDLRQFHGTKRFEVRRRLGEGGFGEVYESYDRNQQQLVALKVLRRSDPAFLYRFKREFRALVDVRHPNLIELYELFREDQLWFFTMELVRGVNFLEYVRHRHGSEATTGRAACSLERFRHASVELAEGIVALHSRGILHRDIKPGNVLVSANGRVRLLDFGLVHEAEISNAHSIMFAGTPAYMAPEQLAFVPAGAAADWYSFGVMLVQALTGATPTWENRFNQESARARLALLADIPADLKDLCVELLDPDPTRRPTATTIRQRLGAPTSPPVGNVVADPELPVIGREPQLATLARLLNQTRDGPAVVVNLFGQSGIGKSTLLRTFRKRLARTDPDVVTLSGRCHENETVPFKALDDLVDGLSRYLKALPAAEADALTPRDASSLVRLFPVLAQVDAIGRGRHKSLDIVDAQELRQRAFASLQDLFARLAERKTVVLVIDDLQWGDLDSGAFLRALFVTPFPPSLLLIASYRVEDVETSPFLKTWHAFLETADSFTIENMALAELTTAESEELAARHLTHVRTGAMEVAQSIAREASGSPFLIEQFARYTPSDTTDTTGPSIRRAIERRLSELPDEGRRLLETLAIAAQPLNESFAYVAAEWIFTNRPTLFRLVAEHFLRVRETNESRQLEIYHDRLREMIVALMSPEVRQQRHRDLAVALERVTQGDPATLAIHHREAGDVERASQYAVAAGDQAAHALAFERAAQWYQQALDYGSWTRNEAIEVRRKLAETLAFAGRGPSAAEVYLKAAETAEEDIQGELQRLAAEQLLRAGHVDRGLAVLEDIARDLGIWLPPTRWLTLMSLLFHRLRARLPVFRFRERSSNDPDARQLMILDVYWSFFIGLGNFDPIRAMDFQARHLALAKRVGDRKRLAVSLAAEALKYAATGGDDSKKIRELFATARALCDATQAPEPLGFIFSMEAFCACLTGNWRRGLDLANQAEKFLSEECSGVAWERATSIQMRGTAVFHLGEWAKYSYDAKRIPDAVEEARARGDVYGMVAAIPWGTLRLLVLDEPSLAHQFIRDTIAALPRTRFLLPNVWALNLEVYIALYAGDGARAWSLVESQWPAVSASYVLEVEYVAIILLDVRARAAIASATNEHQERRLKDALRCARKLASKPSTWAHPISLLIQAGVATVRQQKQLACQLLERAETEFRAAEMAHFVAACQYRRGLLVGGAAGQALVTAADAWAVSEGVANPRRVFEMLAPGRFHEP